ncbi:hypothetical protein B0H21DRAFT_736356 [Amylocystis lapponica]|nr:hypothetical protein B0H21DRAFT_736356 [Amylocystis lapponica]
MASMPTIPPELYDYIIDFLHGNTSALVACSLTCRAWVPATRVHLFCDISLDDWMSSTALCRLLHTAPHLGCHVRDLSIARTIEDLSRDDIQAGLVLCSILIHLSCIQRLGFYFMHLPSVRTLGFHVPLTELILFACQFSAFNDFVDLLLLPATQASSPCHRHVADAIPQSPTPSGITEVAQIGCRKRLKYLSLGRVASRRSPLFRDRQCLGVLRNKSRGYRRGSSARSPRVVSEGSYTGLVPSHSKRTRSPSRAFCRAMHPPLQTDAAL